MIAKSVSNSLLLLVFAWLSRIPSKASPKTKLPLRAYPRSCPKSEKVELSTLKLRYVSLGAAFPREDIEKQMVYSTWSTERNKVDLIRDCSTLCVTAGTRHPARTTTSLCRGNQSTATTIAHMLTVNYSTVCAAQHIPLTGVNTAELDSVPRIPASTCISPSRYWTYSLPSGGCGCTCNRTSQHWH